MRKTKVYRNLNATSRDDQWSYKNSGLTEHCRSALLTGVTFKQPSGVAFEEFFSGSSNHPTYKYRAVWAWCLAEQIEVNTKPENFLDHSDFIVWERLRFNPREHRYFQDGNGNRIDSARYVYLDENRKAWFAR